MIPSDVASRLQVSADAALRPVAPAQEIADKLSGLAVGQKVMAEIQAMLPNGTYRAMINQRALTLALPFSARAGDSLELLVTESDGKLALAVLTRPGAETGRANTTTSTLSTAGQLISTLFSGARETGGRAASVALNANQPIANAPPASAQDLIPLLKQAISQSGLFYESHQAGWVEGRISKAALLMEPQGKLSQPSAFANPAAPTGNEALQAALSRPGGLGTEATAASSTSAASATTAASPETAKPVTAAAQGPLIAPQTQALVHQQLQALATQVFAWQGQVWPGQEMHWEIDEEGARQGSDGEDPAARWSTRVRLSLPNLGTIDALIRLDGQQVAIAMSAGDPRTREQMRTESLTLRSQMSEAGLTLASMGIEAPDDRPADGR